MGKKFGEYLRYMSMVNLGFGISNCSTDNSSKYVYDQYLSITPSAIINTIAGGRHNSG